MQLSDLVVGPAAEVWASTIRHIWPELLVVLTKLVLSSRHTESHVIRPLRGHVGVGRGSVRLRDP